jgi:hypothetical protein
MIVNIFGCPRSGKTTTAARIFSTFKEQNFVCEFVPEQARIYIARKRVFLNLKPEDQLRLTDEDQYKIMVDQFNAEQLMLYSCGKSSIVITDSSPLNALLYMSKEFRESEEIQAFTKKTLSNDTCNFYSQPVSWLGGDDPNRVHNHSQSLEINSLIPSVIFPLLKTKPVVLFGDMHLRSATATSSILQHILDS